MYIIDNATIVQEGRTMAASFLVDRNEIRAIAPSFLHMTCMRMDVSHFFLTPAHIFYRVIQDMPFPRFKSLFSEEFLKRGCNLAIIPFSIQYESEFERELNRARTRLLNCPIDFLFGVQIPARLLTPSLIRICKRSKIPLIFVRISHENDLSALPWGWLREASYPYNPVFIPVLEPQEGRTRLKRLLKSWCKRMEQEKLPFHPEPLVEGVPISASLLRKIGLYPKRGILRAGGEVSYNLYWKGDGDVSVPAAFSPEPVISVDKGRFNSIGGQAIFRPGSGEEIYITKTALFV